MDDLALLRCVPLIYALLLRASERGGLETRPCFDGSADERSEDVSEST